MSSSKKSKTTLFDIDQFMRGYGIDLDPHGDGTYWDDFPGCCAASVLMGLPCKFEVNNRLEEYKLDCAERDAPLAPITKTAVFLEVWRYVYRSHTPGNSLAVMILTQDQHSPSVRVFLKDHGWKKCGQRLATSGNTISLWAKF